MIFRTEIDLEQCEFQIEHSEKLFTIGSCFAENIAQYFKKYKFSVLCNPFGVLYNPVSILNSFQILNSIKSFVKEDLIYDQGEWHSFFHHSDFSHHEIDLCLNNINSAVEDAAQFIRDTNYIVVTYGTSFVYKYIKNDIIVSNCHKLPPDKFTKKRMTRDEIIDSINKTIDLIHGINSSVKIIFTVSPVRHWKDGAVENQVSKALLLLSVNEIVKSRKRCIYFPSYEIMMDDLRDYRFYGEDLIHPNAIATDYIWEKFKRFILSKNCMDLIEKIEKINKAKNHRIRNKDSNKNQEFISRSINQIKDLKRTHPHIRLEDELKYFESFKKR